MVSALLFLEQKEKGPKNENVQLVKAGQNNLKQDLKLIPVDLVNLNSEKVSGQLQSKTVVR